MAKAKKAKAKKDTTPKETESTPMASQEPKAVEPIETTKEPAKVSQGGLQVAPGKSLTSLRGIIGPGETVSPKDFAGGQRTIDDLKAKGLVI